MKLKKLFALLILGATVLGAGLSSSNNGINYFGIETKQVEAQENNSVVINGVTIDHPEQVTTLTFSSRESSHLSGNTLYIGTMPSVTVTIPAAFTNLETLNLTAVDCVPAFYGKTVTIKVTFSSPTLKNVNMFPTGKRQKAYSRPVRIIADLGGSVLDNLFSHTKNWYESKVSTTISNFTIIPDSQADIIIGKNTVLKNCTMTKYDSIWFDSNVHIESGYFGLDCSNIDIHSSTTASGGYYTDAFKDYVTVNIPNFVDAPYEFIRTGRDDFPWRIGNGNPTTIDKVKIDIPENVETVSLITDRDSYIDGNGKTFYLNVNKDDKRVDFGKEFFSLTTISCTDLYNSAGETLKHDIDVYITISTPSIEKVDFNYYTPNFGNNFQANLYLNLFFSNYALKNIVTQYGNSGTKFVHALLNDFTTLSSAQAGGYSTSYSFGDLVELNNCRVEYYHSLAFHGTSKINSGYFDIGEINPTLSGNYTARGGYYSDAFKNYADSTNTNFKEKGFSWEPYDDDKFVWTLGGVPFFDRIPITDKSVIRSVYLMTDERSRLNGDILYINISHGASLDFDEGYNNLIGIGCYDLFEYPYFDYGIGVQVNVDVTTSSLKYVEFEYKTTSNYNFLTRVDFDLNFHNTPLDEFVLYHQWGESIASFTVTGVNKNNVEKNYDFRILTKDDPISLNDCNFLDYSYLDFSANEGTINSGYYDFGNENPSSVVKFIAPYSGCGGYYTQAFADYIDEQNSLHFVAEGYKWAQTLRHDFPWTIIKDEPLSPSPEEVQEELDRITTMPDDSINCFGFKIAYSYNYPNKDNVFQIQMTFDYQGIMDYCNYIAMCWGKEGLKYTDDVYIDFVTEKTTYIRYSLFDNEVRIVYPQITEVIDPNPTLLDDSSNPGFKIFTLNLGDLMGVDHDNVSAIINPTLHVNIAEYGTTHPRYFSSSLHKQGSNTPINFSFEYLLNKYLSMPAYKDNASLKQCKADLGL